MYQRLYNGVKKRVEEDYELIRKAEKEDIAAVSASYQELFAYETEHGNTTNWAEGVYPTANIF